MSASCCTITPLKSTLPVAAARIPASFTSSIRHPYVRGDRHQQHLDLPASVSAVIKACLAALAAEQNHFSPVNAKSFGRSGYALLRGIQSPRGQTDRPLGPATVRPPPSGGTFHTVVLTPAR